MIRNIWIFILLAVASRLSAQCVKEVKSFQSGEKISYQAFYNWGFVWVHAGDVEFTVGQRSYQNKQVYQFETNGWSLKSYDWIYKVRDRFQSLVDMNGFRTMWAERNTSEGSYKAFENYVFTVSGKILSTVENSKKPMVHDTLNSPGCIFDVLSLMYFSRTIDFNRYNVNDKIPLRCVVDNEVVNLFLRYRGKETIKTRDNKKFRCIKFSVLLVEGTIFKGGEDMFVWVTDDDNRIPVLVEAKILIGSVKGYLDKVEGARNPMTALVK